MPEKRQKSRYTTLIELLCLLFTVAAALVVRIAWYEPVYIPSDSMSPALKTGDRLMIHKRAYLDRRPQRGDIVLFTWPERPGEKVVKRVVGLPGERLLVWSGRVMVNDEWLEEPYVRGRLIRELPLRAKLGPAEVWVLGDNRNRSEDSRDLGPLPLDRIIGRAAYLYWPLSRRGPIQRIAPDAWRSRTRQSSESRRRTQKEDDQ